MYVLYCKDDNSFSLQVQVGDRLLSLNGEELMELTSKDCEYMYSTFIYMLYMYLAISSSHAHACRNMTP